MLLQSIWKFSTPLCKDDNKDSDGFSVSKKLYSSGRCSQETFSSKFFIPTWEEIGGCRNHAVRLWLLLAWKSSLNGIFQKDLIY